MANKKKTHPQVLNYKHYIKIHAPTDGAGRWKLGNKAIGFVQSITESAMGGLIDGVSLFSESGAESVKGFADDMSKSLDTLRTSNGITPLVFKAFIEEIPGWNTTNLYGDNAIGGIVTTVIGGATKLAAGGGLTPNLNTQFQLPEMWKGQSPMSLAVDTIITPDTLAILPPQLQGLAMKGTETSPGSKVVIASIIAIMLAAPRQFTLTKGKESIENLFMAAPPVIDLQIGPFFYPTVRTKTVSVTFPKDINYYDANGFPNIAKVRFTFQMNMTFTQENWHKMAQSVNATGKASLYSNSLLLSNDPEKNQREIDAAVKAGTIMAKLR